MLAVGVYIIYCVYTPTVMLEGIHIIATPDFTNSTHFLDEFSSNRHAVSVFVAYFYPLFSDYTVSPYPVRRPSLRLSPRPLLYQIFDPNNLPLSFLSLQWRCYFLKLLTTHHRGRFMIPTSSTMLLISGMLCLKLQSQPSTVA